jgi:hypothetical protein
MMHSQIYLMKSHDDGHVNHQAKSGFLLIKQNKKF